MNHMVAKTGVAALAAGMLAGCATTVDMGGPLGHYRYDSHPVAAETTTVPERVATSPAPDVAYREKTYVYREPAVTYLPRTMDSAPVVVYRESRVVAEPTVTRYSPTVVYGADDDWLRYQDHGQ